MSAHLASIPCSDGVILPNTVTASGESVGAIQIMEAPISPKDPVNQIMGTALDAVHAGAWVRVDALIDAAVARGQQGDTAAAAVAVFLDAIRRSSWPTP